jgi:hypothetical protein
MAKVSVRTRSNFMSAVTVKRRQVYVGRGVGLTKRVATWTNVIFGLRNVDVAPDR